MINGSLSRFIILNWMFRRITFAVFLRGDHFKRLIIPEHGENDVADFMHHSPDGYIFLFAFAFVSIVAVDNRVYRCFCAFIHLKVIGRHHMQDTPCRAGSPFGHMDFVPIKFAGLLYGRVKTELGIKLFR